LLFYILIFACQTFFAVCCQCGSLALIKFTQPVLVERENPSSRQNTVKEIQQRAATAGAWPQILVFPEGTCTNRTCLISFKPGLQVLLYYVAHSLVYSGISQFSIIILYSVYSVGLYSRLN